MLLSSGGVHVGELLELHQGCQGPFRGSRGKVEFLSRHRRGKRPHLTLRGESPAFSVCSRKNGVPLKLTTWPSVTCSCCLRKVKSPCELREASQDALQSVPGLRSLSRVEAEPQGSSPGLKWISAFLWSFNRVVRPDLVSCGDMQVSFPLEM